MNKYLRRTNVSTWLEVVTWKMKLIKQTQLGIATKQLLLFFLGFFLEEEIERVGEERERKCGSDVLQLPILEWVCEWVKSCVYVHVNLSVLS